MSCFTSHLMVGCETTWTSSTLLTVCSLSTQIDPRRFICKRYVSDRVRAVIPAQWAHDQHQSDPSTLLEPVGIACTPKPFEGMQVFDLGCIRHTLQLGPSIRSSGMPTTPCETTSGALRSCHSNAEGRTMATEDVHLARRGRLHTCSQACSRRSNLGRHGVGLRLSQSQVPYRYAG